MLKFYFSLIILLIVRGVLCEFHAKIHKPDRELTDSLAVTHLLNAHDHARLLSVSPAQVGDRFEYSMA